ncbi:MAG TPA: aminoglycoside phosphotransferase family protein [Candidatus Baltobacteraceae bacterium]|nr:aminoglycoside phosphotransferase family protein [Candidatus Baltobacteraceae bacterium]
MSTSGPIAHRVDLGAIAQGFPSLGRFQGGGPYGSGHINDTFAVIFDRAGTLTRYIFQRINHRIFKDVPALMDNIQRVTAHAATKAHAASGADVSRRVLTLVPARDGRPFHQDPHGSYWRCYLFIEKARTYDVIENPKQAYEAARAFGAFQQMLVDLPGNRLHETIPFFHHTRQRFEALRAAVAADRRGRRPAAASELEFAFAREGLVDVLLDLQECGEIPERVTHNDTKLNNVMLDDATQEGICVIDLDTVMPGLALYDFGDMVRSATSVAAEDDRDLGRVAMRMPIYEALVAGYLASAGRFLNAAERAHLAFSGKLITFEIGLRFLTDYLEGDVYFKTKRPGHNLDRARNQFALVRSIEQQEPAMQAVVERFARNAPP